MTRVTGQFPSGAPPSPPGLSQSRSSVWLLELHKWNVFSTGPDFPLASVYRSRWPQKGALESRAPHPSSIQRPSLKSMVQSLLSSAHLGKPAQGRDGKPRAQTETSPLSHTTRPMWSWMALWNWNPQAPEGALAYRQGFVRARGWAAGSRTRSPPNPRVIVSNLKSAVSAGRTAGPLSLSGAVVPWLWGAHSGAIQQAGDTRGLPPPCLWKSPLWFVDGERTHVGTLAGGGAHGGLASLPPGHNGSLLGHWELASLSAVYSPMKEATSWARALLH